MTAIARRSIFAIVAALLLTTAAPAAEKALTVGDALNMLLALRNLDGRAVVVKENVVITPWDFASGTLRLRIARNIMALTEIEKTANDARESIIREILRRMPAGADGKPQNEIPAVSAEAEEFRKQYAAVLAEPTAVTLSRIRASELRLDKNEIPTSTLAVLSPILDDDVSPK